MNKKQKGARKENLCAEELVRTGHKILYKSCTVKRGPFFIGLDFADLFDVVAVIEVPMGIGNITRVIWRFISVKTFSTSGDYFKPHQEAIKKFKEQYGFNNAEFELWLWKPPAWRGRGKNRHFQQAGWEVIRL